MKKIRIFRRSEIDNSELGQLQQETGLFLVVMTRDTTYYHYLKDTLTNANVRIFEKVFHEKYAIVGPKLLDYFVSAQKSFDQNIWWFTQMGSRSVTASNYCCRIIYTLCLVECLETNSDNNIVVVVDSSNYGSFLAQTLRNLGYAIHYSDSLSARTKDSFQSFVRVFAPLAFFTFSTVFRMILTRLFLVPIPKQNEKVVIFRSWLSQGNLGERGSYVDRNFGELISKMQLSGRSIWINPCLYNTGVTFLQILKRAKSSNHRFLFNERVINLSNVYKTVSTILRVRNLEFPKLNISGIDLTPILRESILLDSCNPSFLSYNLFKFALLNILKSGVKITEYYYPMENNAVEKPPLQVLRMYSMNTISYGFQHSVWFKGQLAMQVEKSESSYHPLPKCILFTGNRYLDILTRCGFTDSKLEIAPSYRFLYVHKYKYQQIDRSGILVLPSFDTHQALELVAQCVAARNAVAPKETIYVKPHPTTNIKSINEMLSRKNIDKYEFVEGSPLDWIQKTKVVFDSGSSIAALEVIMSKTPLLRVATGNSCFLDPLWDEYPIPVSFFLKETIENLEKIMSNQIPTAQLEDLALKYRNQYFQNI